MWKFFTISRSARLAHKLPWNLNGLTVSFIFNPPHLFFIYRFHSQKLMILWFYETEYCENTRYLSLQRELLHYLDLNKPISHSQFDRTSKNNRYFMGRKNVGTKIRSKLANTYLPHPPPPPPHFYKSSTRRYSYLLIHEDEEPILTPNTKVARCTFSYFLSPCIFPHNLYTYSIIKSCKVHRHQ